MREEIIGDCRMNRAIWRLMEANCNEAEIAKYYRIPHDVARVWMLRAKTWAMKRALA